jgi:hypothetical protein
MFEWASKHKSSEPPARCAGCAGCAETQAYVITGAAARAALGEIVGLFLRSRGLREISRTNRARAAHRLVV